MKETWTDLDQTLLELLKAKQDRISALEFRNSVSKQLREIADDIDSSKIDFRFIHNEKDTKNLFMRPPNLKGDKWHSLRLQYWNKK